MSKRERLDEDDLPPSKRVLIERNIEEEYFSMYGTIVSYLDTSRQKRVY